MNITCAKELWGLKTRREIESGTTHLRLDYFQIPHLDPACREIGYLELDADRPLPSLRSAQPPHAAPEPAGHAAAVLVIALHGGQAQLGAHEEFLAPAELLDLPDYGGLLGGVVHGADVGAEARGVGVFGDGDEDLDVVGCGAAFELCAGLDGGG